MGPIFRPIQIIIRSAYNYVYLMVKAYQTTVLEPIELEWKTSELTDKILNLVGPEGGFDAASLDAHTKVLLPVYEENLNTVLTKAPSSCNWG
jgi:hypothetical protein